MNCKQESMSSRRRALAAMRYSFSIFTLFASFLCLLISSHVLVCFHHLLLLIQMMWIERIKKIHKCRSQVVVVVTAEG